MLAACTNAPNAEPIQPRTVSEYLSPYVAINHYVVLFDNASVHVGDGRAPLEKTSVLIEGDTIKAVGPKGSFPIPANAYVIDLSGGSVMPGIVGMHNHLHMPGITLMDYTAPRMSLASGVTTIQTAGSANPGGEIRLKQAIDAGEVPGPDIVLTAPYITGPDGNAVMFKPSSEAEARDFVKDWAARGMRWIKLYRHTDPDMAIAIIDEAHKHGLKVTGHLCSITFAEAAKMGIDSLEHGLNAATDFVDDKPKGQCVGSRASKVSLDIGDPKINELIQTLVEEEVTLTSTLAILESGFPHRPQARPEDLNAMSPALRSVYDERQTQLAGRLGNTTSSPEYWALITGFERRFIEAGGHLVAGPDTGRHVFLGFGDQRNFELLVEAGFSVAETIKIMTHNGAQSLDIGDDLGLIKAGYKADLIVLSKNVTHDIDNIRNPIWVFKDGLGYDPNALLADVQGQVGLR